MKYYVNLGGVNLHRVTSFELSSDRDIDDYDGVGSGKFNVPDAKNPREWTIECELLQNGTDLSGLNTWSASELFKQFETWLGKTDAPIRMVKTDSAYPAANLSVLVWFKSYKQEESEMQGVYDTTITVVEYKPVGIKTTGIPTVSRPGKVPVPKKVTITKKNTVYKNLKGGGIGTVTDAQLARDTAQGKSYYKHLQSVMTNAKTGKPVTNAATAKEKTTYAVATAQTVKTINGITYSSNNDTMAQANIDLLKQAGTSVAKATSAAGTAISKAFDGWKVKFKKNNSWAPW